MSKLIIAVLVSLLYVSVAASEVPMQSKHSFLVLKFSSSSTKNQWITWYLDKGGEEISGFYVYNWSNTSFDMKAALEYDFVEIKKEYCSEKP